ncbi:MAG: hypothetical protein OJF49_001743 [Ktedonobacterales bacterium]|jgi:ubiquinone/menaquinone biosynthesis C-methylase UbiE|nr:MAG: hypothetical protein OJF49_001743 [Ktedonobacterales bacterium]
MRWFGWLRRGSAQVAMHAVPIMALDGRRRTPGVPYPFPVDIEETNRLDFQHYVFRYALQGIYAAPVTDPASILDVGTGTGVWAREMATHFPRAKVIGLDVNLPPTDERAGTGVGLDLRPSNYEFVPGNILEGLPFADGAFDFVHMRLLVTALPHDRWPFVVNEMVRVTRIGGWVESVEATTLEQGGPAVDMLMHWVTEMLARRGVLFSDGGAVGDLLRDAGLANITARKMLLPFGAHGDRLGMLLATDFFNGFPALGSLIVAQGIATQEQFDTTLATARADTASSQVRCLSPVYVAYGQRMR